MFSQGRKRAINENITALMAGHKNWIFIPAITEQTGFHLPIRPPDDPVGAAYPLEDAGTDACRSAPRSNQGRSRRRGGEEWRKVERRRGLPRMEAASAMGREKSLEISS
jgi:hypothetical protein